MIHWLCTDRTVYGTVCAVSALMMSAVVGVICTSVCIRCKHKGNVYIRHCTIKGVHSLLGKMESTQIELEQNSAYHGINTFPSSLTRVDLEPCPAYGIVYKIFDGTIAQL